MGDYWNDFIPAIRTTRLGDCTDSDPELATAWLGWQARDSEISALKADNQRLLMHSGHPSYEELRNNTLILADENDCLKAECERLRQLIKDIADMAHDGLNHWNNDRDAKAGKYLPALSGDLPNYNDTAAKITMHMAQLTKEPNP